MQNIHTILLVDDDPVQLAILETYFLTSGAKKVLKAINGHSALALISEFNKEIKLILCDLKMPEMDGIEFMRHLKGSSYDGPIAILSSADRFLIESAEKLATIHGLNIIGTIKKPMSKDKLDNLVALASMKRKVYSTANSPLVDGDFLKEAIKNGQIIPYYQPKTETRTLQVAGVEALARWVHPDLGVIGPGVFMPLVEQKGLMKELTHSILISAINDAKTWKSHGINTKISVNVTSDILEDLEFPDFLLARLQSADINRSHMIFEVTEVGMLDANASTMEVLARLRIKDIDISIDDFGTGFSNIEQLKKFPYSELKIDQSFISAGPHDTFANASVRASVTLGRELNMRLVAEGVETREQWDYVADQGIDQVQGFFIAKPMPAERFQSWYIERNGLVDIGERDLSGVELYAPMTKQGAG